MNILKRPLVLIGLILGLLLVGLAALPFFIPTETYRTQIEQAATRALDREVTLDEDVSLGLFPRLSASIGGVQIANPEGFSRAHMLTAGELRGVVRWGPLLGGRVEISEFVFEDADLMLERLDDGRANWEFPAASEPAQPDTGTEPASTPSASVDTARLTNATVVFIDATNDVRHEVRDLNIMARMTSMDAPLRVEAEGLYQDNPFSADLDLANLEAFLSGAESAVDLTASHLGASVSFDGALTGGEATSVSGGFEADIASIPPLLDLVAIDLGYDLAPLGRIEATGSVAGPVDALSLTDVTLETDGSALQSRFTGGLSLADPMSVTGAVTVSAANLGAGLAAMGVDLPIEARVLEALDASLDVSGPLDALAFRNIEVSHRGDLLSASYMGDIALTEAGSLTGDIQASSDALRDLAAAMGSPLPAGDTMQTFALSTSLSGSFTSLSATGLNARLDDTQATGSASVDLSGDKPSIVADLTIPTLALDSFLVESEDTAPAESSGSGWSNAAIDLAGLDMIDIDLSLSSNTVSLGEIVLSDASLDAEITNGRLNAVIDKAGLFGGEWSGAVSLDGSGATPGAQFKLDGTAVAIESALESLAGLDSLGGLGRVQIDLSTSGGTIADMVSALSGSIGANLADGQIKGFNVAQLVRSRENIIAALADGSLALALSEEAETDFTAFDADIRFDNGIGSLSALSFQNPLLLFDGSGTIDLPNQSIDLSIIPKVDQNAAGRGTSTVAVGDIPIPIRLNGSWFSPSIRPDTRLLQQSLQASAIDQVRNRATDALGVDEDSAAGAIIGSVLGTRSRASDTDASGDAGDTAGSGDAADASGEQEETETVEDAVEGLVRDRLGGLFGNQDRDDDANR